MAEGGACGLGLLPSQEHEERRRDMSKTTTVTGLLAVCIQDLHAGCVAAAEGLPGVAQAACDEGLKVAMAEVIASAARRAETLRVLGFDLDGPKNLWMAGILDDAERDTRSIAAAPLLDIAMIGAVRKALAAERVSIDTAVAVAAKVGRTDTADALASNAADIDALDEVLRIALARLSR